MAYGPALTELFSYYVAAVHELGSDSSDREFSIQIMTAITAEGLEMVKRAVRKGGRAIVSLVYDVDGDMPQLTHVWIMMPTTDPAQLARGNDLTLLVDCKLWAPANDGRIVIVAPEKLGGHFTLSSDGNRLEHRVGTPARDLTAGMRRARQRIARMAKAGVGTAPATTRLLAVA